MWVQAHENGNPARPCTLQCARAAGACVQTEPYLFFCPGHRSDFERVAGQEGLDRVADRGQLGLWPLGSPPPRPLIKVTAPRASSARISQAPNHVVVTLRDLREPQIE